MSPYGGYQNYKEASVNTMTKGELLILLYDELLKRLMRAELALNKQDYDLFETSIVRCRDIVLYLKDTLDYKYEISSQLRNMYDFFLLEISKIQAGRRVEVIAELRPLVTELRDTFKEADRLSSAG